MFAHDIPEFDPVQYPEATAVNPLDALAFLKQLNLPRLHVVTIKPLPEGKSDVYAAVYEKGATTLRPFLEQLALTSLANVYFCPNLASGRGVPGEADVSRLYALAVDIDPLDTTNDAAWDTERRRIKTIVHDAVYSDVTPSYVINTGNGAQLVYFLNSVENTPETRVRYLAVVKALSRRVGGDPALTHRVSSLFRVPGTQNVPSQTKRNKGRRAVPGSVWFRSEARYDLDDLYDAVASGVEPEPERTADHIDGLTYAMLVEASVKLDPHIDAVINERIERFEGFARLHADVASGTGGEKKDRSRLDFRYCAELIEAGMALAAVACALARYGAQKREMGSAAWEKYIVDTVLNAKAQAHKPTEDWYDASGDEDMEQGTTEQPGDMPFRNGAATVKEPLDNVDHLIDNLLPQRSVSMMYGPSNSGKSLLALEMCTCLTSGIPFAGHATNSDGLVIYFAMEGGGGFSKRLRAISLAYPERAFDRLYWTSQQYGLFAKGGVDIDAMLAHIDKALAVGPIDLVVIDMLVTASAGANENSGEDMGKVMANIDRIERKSKAHVMVLHHTGKDERRGARGWSGMRGKVDTEIEVKKHGKDETKIGALRVTKQREMDYDGRGPQYLIKSVPVGNNRKGEPVRGAYVHMLPIDPIARQRPLLENEELVRDVMRELGRPCTVDEIMDHAGLKVSLVRRAVKGLQTKGYVYPASEASTGVNGKAALYGLYEGYDEKEQTDEHNDPFA